MATPSKKIVTLTVQAEFRGDYIPANQTAEYLESWIDCGLEDRDDLVGWTITTNNVVETPLSEETE